MSSEKRASSPYLPTALTNDAPPPLKSRRLNGTQSSSSGGPRKAVEMGGVWTLYIDNLLDSEDFGESLLGLESMISRLHIPSRTHIRQLLALALSPSSCIRPPKKSSDGTRPESKLKPPTLDPFPSTDRKIRLLALRLLEDIAATLGGSVIFRALKGHGRDESLLAYDVGVAELSEAEDDQPEEDDSPLQLAGKRVGACEDVWALLGGAAAKKVKPRADDDPMDVGSWEVLRTFVGIWEGEARKRAENEGDAAVSPSLLRTLVANISGVRTLSKGKGPMPMVFWPFQALEEMHNDQDEDMEEDGESKRKVPVDSDEMPLAEKQSVAMRLLALLAQAAAAGRLDSHSLLEVTSMELFGLRAESFGTFVERLPLSSPHFTVRLCSFFLDTYSLASPSPPNGSPAGSPSRRRTLGAQGSSLSLSSVGTIAPPARHPLPSSREILSLLAKLPRSFPAPPGETSTLAPTTQSRMPAPKRAGQATWAKIERDCASHALLKQALLEGVWGTLDSEHGREAEKERLEENLLVDGEARRVLREVEQKVQEARGRSEV